MEYQFETLSRNLKNSKSPSIYLIKSIKINVTKMKKLINSNLKIVNNIYKTNVKAQKKWYNDEKSKLKSYKFWDSKCEDLLKQLEYDCTFHETIKSINPDMWLKNPIQKMIRSYQKKLIVEKKKKQNRLNQKKKKALIKKFKRKKRSSLYLPSSDELDDSLWDEYILNEPNEFGESRDSSNVSFITKHRINKGNNKNIQFYCKIRNTNEIYQWMDEFDIGERSRALKKYKQLISNF